MPYPFPPELATAVHEQLATGEYASEDELLLKALQALKDRNESLAAIREGIDDFENGRFQDVRGLANRVRALARADENA